MSTPTLKDLKLGAILSGRLSESQVKVITHMPFVVFDNVKEVEIDYDINLEGSTRIDHSGSYVNLRLSLAKGGKCPPERVKMLVDAVKGVTFQTVKVKVFRRNSDKPLEGSDV